MTKYIKKYIHLNPLAMFMVILLNGCQDLLEVPNPSNRLVTSSVFSDSLTTQSAINGMYRTFYNSLATSYFDVQAHINPARLADETYAVNNLEDNFTNNTLFAGEIDVNYLWNHAYSTIYTVNSVIEGVEASTTITASLKRQAIGEALFIRALTYFYLVNYFGDVPLILTTDVNLNVSIPRSSTGSIYNQIVSDLTTAKNTLPTTFAWSQNDRTRANTWAASALLARVHLYQKNWAAAEDEATRVIDHTSLFSLVPDPSNVFLKNSSETILAFYATLNGFPPQTLENEIRDASTLNYAMRDELISAFETDDTRATKWVGTITIENVVYKFPSKYKSRTNVNAEFQICLRLAEQYLIRAEARMWQDKLIGNNSAQSDLNVIRNRAGLANTTASTTATLTSAIAQERRIELFVEWGDRWFELKRTNTATEVLAPIKSRWVPTATLYPIPEAAMLTNPNLTQNPGY